jgi:16S rRNA G966 N2-methylase RsmD
MRIVGGRFGGRTLLAPKSQAIRPTSDRLREALFNILTHAYGDPVAGARVLDLFAGTGALGLEALSRGAAFVLFVDDGAEARALLATSMRWARAARPRSTGAMRPGSVRSRRSRRSRSLFSIRPMARARRNGRSPRPATAAGSRPMR